MAAAEGFSLTDRYAARAGRSYLTGIQALTRAVLDQARRDRAAGRDQRALVTGYEGSPLAGFDIELARQRRWLDEVQVRHQPAVNEELAATALTGTQLARQVATLTCAGVTGWWYGKSPGLDRASDALRHGNLIGTDGRGGVVAIVGDDPAAKSSTIPGCSEYALADLSIPTLVPGDVGQILEFAWHAVELSRMSGLWAALRVPTVVADSGSTLELSSWAAPALDDLPTALVPYRHRPTAFVLGATLMGLERSLVEVRLPLAQEYLRRAGVDRIVGAAGSGPARVGLVAGGPTYLALRQALSSLGMGADAELERRGIRILRVGAPWPLDAEIVRRFGRGLTEVLVVEDKRTFLEDQVRIALYGGPDTPRVVGKVDAQGRPLLSRLAELTADDIAEPLQRFLTDTGMPGLPAVTPAGAAERVSTGVAGQDAYTPDPRRSLQLAVRTPHFCSGCPHNSSTRVEPGTLVSAGIGCHALVMLGSQPERGAIAGTSQMGGEGGFWLGMEPFVAETHCVQNIGDGTFAHSGSLGVRAAVAAGAHVTFKLLRNSAVAMTGGQTAVGQRSLADLVDLLLAEGVAKVVVTSDDPTAARAALRSAKHLVSVRHRDDIEAVQRELAAVPGVTVLIHEQECATERRRRWRRGRADRPQRVMINERVCEGCGDCGQISNCLSVHPVETELGRKSRIHQSSCNLDLSCLKGDCPSFVVVTTMSDGAGPPSSPGSAAPAPAAVARPALPEPTPRVAGGQFRMRITGIGGTGIVTVAQLLATAAALSGKEVRILDQLGLSQKGGPVVSDLVVSDEVLERPPRLAAGECDLYLGCDALVAAEPRHLVAADPRRTVAVLSGAQIPTAAMVVDPGVRFPATAQVEAAVRPAVRELTVVDAADIARDQLGDEQFANLVLVGAAYQLGVLPIDAAAIDGAIEINGIAVEANRAAFRLGRQAMIDSARGEAAPGGSGSVGPVDIDALIDARAAELAAYQDRAYAARYRTVIERVRRREREATGTTELTEAVARYLYKLMAYKDEYEVARLLLAPEFEAQLREQFGDDAAYRMQLHPPVLRALGMRRKLSLGPNGQALLRPLLPMRRLRGTRLDPFGHTEIRRVERSLVPEYVAAVDVALAGLTPETLTAAVELACLPDLVRGYEQIKLRAVETYRARLAERVQLMEAGAPSVN